VHDTKSQRFFHHVQGGGIGTNCIKTDYIVFIRRIVDTPMGGKQPLPKATESTKNSRFD
jgi:hypothetical protein